MAKAGGLIRAGILRVGVACAVAPCFFLVGCSHSHDSDGPTGVGRAAETVAGSGAVRVVVSNGGGGVNIYHEIFRKGGPIYGDREPSSVTPEVLAEFGIDESHIIDLTITGNPEADYAADRDRLDATNAGEPYWIRGTNLIVYPSPSLDDSAHFVSLNANSLSTRSTSDILLANPDAVVAFVEGSRLEDDTQGEIFDKAVDIHAIYAPNFPIAPGDFFYEYLYDEVVRHGKLLFSSVDAVVPFPTQIDFGPGAWWSIAIGYFDKSGTNGKDPLTPTITDFVADQTLLTPAYCAYCQTEYQEADATGAVSNYAAGVASKVVLDLRRNAGHAGGIRQHQDEAILVEAGDWTITNWQIRRALEQASAVPGLSDFDPTAVLQDNSVAIQPSIEQAPWLSVGWGLLTPEIADNAVDYLWSGSGDAGSIVRHEKTADHCRIMLASFEARVEWSEEIRNRVFVDLLAREQSQDSKYIRCDASMVGG